MNINTWWDATVVASINAGWFDADFVRDKAVSKRLKALSNLHTKLWRLDKQIDFGSLPTVVIFAPTVREGGHVRPGILPTGALFMYLAPTLEFDSQPDVDHTVAHEFAHVVLGHCANSKHTVVDGLPHEQQPRELEADALASEWGFPRRKRGMSGFAKIFLHFCVGGAAKPSVLSRNAV